MKTTVMLGACVLAAVSALGGCVSTTSTPPLESSASSEANAAVGDPANDAIRIDGRFSRVHARSVPRHEPPYPSLAEVAEMEGMDRAYLSRMVNLTTLAPDIVAAILDESLPDHVTLFDLASGTPLLWDEQRALLADASRIRSPRSRRSMTGRPS